MQRMIMVTAIASALVGLFVGYSFGKWSGENKMAVKPAENSAQTQNPAGMAPMAPMMGDIRQVSATIKSIDGNTLVVTVMGVPGMNGTGEADERTVTVNDATKISMMKTKDPAVFQKEMEEFQKNYTPPTAVTPGTVPTAPATAPMMPPMSMERTEISLADLKVGLIVQITASENIKDAKSFTAVTIEANDAAVAGPAPMAPMMAPPMAPAAPAPSQTAAPAPAPAQ